MTRRTVLKGAFRFLQDITKGTEVTIDLDYFGPDGTVLIEDGTGTPIITYYQGWGFVDDDRFTARTRDGRRVVRFERVIGHNDTWLLGWLALAGETSPVFSPMKWHTELTGLFYLDDAQGHLRINPAGSFTGRASVALEVDALGANMVNRFQVSQPTLYDDPGWPEETTAKNPADLAGWYWVKMYVEKGLASQRGKYWKLGDDEPSVWHTEIAPDRFPHIDFIPAVFGYHHSIPVTADMIAEAATVRYRMWQ